MQCTEQARNKLTPNYKRIPDFRDSNSPKLRTSASSSSTSLSDQGRSSSPSSPSPPELVPPSLDDWASRLRVRSTPIPVEGEDVIAFRWWSTKRKTGRSGEPTGGGEGVVFVASSYFSAKQNNKQDCGLGQDERAGARTTSPATVEKQTTSETCPPEPLSLLPPSLSHTHAHTRTMHAQASLQCIPGSSVYRSSTVVRQGGVYPRQTVVCAMGRAGGRGGLQNPLVRSTHSDRAAPGRCCWCGSSGAS